MYRLATVKPIAVASSTGSRIDDAGHVKRQLRTAALPRSMASLEDRTMRFRLSWRYQVIA
jgi:hypothetical protein